MPDDELQLAHKTRAEVVKAYDWSRFTDAANINDTQRSRMIFELRHNASDLEARPDRGFLLRHHPTRIFEWHAVIFGKKGTPLEGGYYHVLIQLGADFPFRPPTVQITTSNMRLRTSLPIIGPDVTPEDEWVTSWSLTHIVEGLRRELHDTPHEKQASGTPAGEKALAFGNVEGATDAEIRDEALHSAFHNVENAVTYGIHHVFPKLYMQWYDEVKRYTVAHGLERTFPIPTAAELAVDGLAAFVKPKNNAVTAMASAAGADLRRKRVKRGQKWRD